MAIIDKLQKISDTVWELPTTYKQGMRVPARIIATEKLVQLVGKIAALPPNMRAFGDFLCHHSDQGAIHLR